MLGHFQGARKLFGTFQAGKINRNDIYTGEFLTPPGNCRACSCIRIIWLTLVVTSVPVSTAGRVLSGVQCSLERSWKGKSHMPVITLNLLQWLSYNIIYIPGNWWLFNQALIQHNCEILIITCGGWGWGGLQDKDGGEKHICIKTRLSGIAHYRLSQYWGTWLIHWTPTGGNHICLYYTADTGVILVFTPQPND